MVFGWRFFLLFCAYCLLSATAQPCFAAQAADAAAKTPPQKAAPQASGKDASKDASAAPLPAQFTPDTSWLDDREALDTLQKDTFRYMWDDAHPVSGLAYEANYYWEVRPAAVGGTGFGVAAIVVATDRGWITRDQALTRLLTIASFLRDKTPRLQLHGAFPHWLNGETGAALSFGKGDAGADIVETSLLMQGLLIARAYFNGPGEEERLRGIITEIWQDIDWNWFTEGKENGIHWHWGQEDGFSGLRILGYNECLITYILGLASPTHPISRKSYDYWTSGKGYQPKDVYGYTLEATLPGGGPLFTAQYSFIGLNPRLMADEYVKRGYFVRNVTQTLSNRGYCLYNAPPRNRYSESYWGLTAGNSKNGYVAAEPGTADPGSIAPTGALTSMPYTPWYSLQVLRALIGRGSDEPEDAAPGAQAAKGAQSGKQKEKQAQNDKGVYERVWGPYGPYDGFSLRDNWVSDKYLAIDQLPIICMVENYRSGLLWKLFMADPDVRNGLVKAGITEPDLKTGFPEMVVPLKKEKKDFVPDACDLVRHPDTGRYLVSYYSDAKGPVRFVFSTESAQKVHTIETEAAKGRNELEFEAFIAPGSDIYVLSFTASDGEKHSLPVRFH